MAIDCDPASAITPTQATIGGTASNTPVTEELRIEVSLAPGGPFTPMPTPPGGWQTGNGVPPVSFTYTYGGVPDPALTPNTTYYYRAYTTAIGGGPTIQQGPTICNFTTAAAPVTVECNPATRIHAQQAQLNGTGHNIPATDTVRLSASLTPGGPYTDFVGVPQAGDGSNPQLFIQGILHPDLDPSTTYYFRAERYNAGNVLIEASSECQFTTLANDATGYIDCQVPPSFFDMRRHLSTSIISPNDDVPGSIGSDYLYTEVGPTAAGPWSEADLTVGPDFAVAGPNPQIGQTPGSMGSYITGFLGQPLTHNTDYFVRYTIGNLDQGAPPAGDVQTLVCGPITTPDRPTVSCNAPQTRPGDGTATFTVGMDAVGQNGGDPLFEQGDHLQVEFSNDGGATWGNLPASTGPNVPPANVQSVLTASAAGLPAGPLNWRYVLIESPPSPDLGASGIWFVGPTCGPLDFAQAAPATAHTFIKNTAGAANRNVGDVIDSTVLITNTDVVDMTISVSDIVPASPAGTTRTYTATGTGTSSGFTAAGVGSINDPAVTVTAGNSVAYQIHDTVTAAGLYQNTASIQEGAFPVENQNGQQVTVGPVAPPQYSVVKTTTPGPYTAPVIIESTVTITNTGTVAANGVAFQDLIPASPPSTTRTEWSSVATGGATGNSSNPLGGTDIIDVLNLPVGSSVTYTIRDQVIEAGNYENIATVPGSTGGPDFGGGVFPVAEPPFTTLSKVTPAGPFNVGDVIVSTITIQNNTAVPKTNVPVLDPVPAAPAGTTRAYTAAASGAGNPVTGFTPAGVGAINDSVDFANNSALLTYTISDTVTAAGNYENIANIDGGPVSGGVRVVNAAVQPPFLNCAPATAITANSATLNAAGGNIPIGDPITICWGPAGGPFTNCLPAGNGNGAANQNFSANAVGLAALTSYGYVVRQNAVVLATCDPAFTTTAVIVPTPIELDCLPGCAPNVAQPLPGVNQPCITCGDGTPGGGAAGPDVEPILLCDIDAQGNLLGTALAVYQYDSTGAPVGAPTFVIPGTNNPYVVQGVLQPCGEAACLPPVQFCFSSTATVDQPGRMYDLDLQIAQGFGVQGIIKDLVDTPVAITWAVTDPTGAEFATALQQALQSQFAGQTVTVTPNAVDACTGLATFAIHIECLRLDQNPIALLQLRYNGGRDLIINPAFTGVPPITDFTFSHRADEPIGPFAAAFGVPIAVVDCTNVANSGWETNDVQNAFESWGGPGSPYNVSAGTTPTPRGTGVHEINSFGGPPIDGLNQYGTDSPTIWQTFNVPAAGNFNIRVVVGGRTQTDIIGIKLSTGDVDDAGIGDILNTTVVAPQVTDEDATGSNNHLGGPAQPWTNFNQSVALAPGLYTLAFKGPTNGSARPNFGGLFTDMRVFQDAPNTIANFANDDNTCTVPVTSNSTDCQLWAPRCSNGDIVSWRRLTDGTELANAAFWGQIPAPGCCLPEAADAAAGGSGNLINSYLVCGVTETGTRTMVRTVITDQSGGPISDQFIDTNGDVVSPTSWQPGDCSGVPTIEIDQYDTALIPQCFDTGETWFTYERVQFNNRTLVETRVRHWINQTTLVDQLVAPAGAIVECAQPAVVTVINDEPGCALNVPYTRRTIAQFDETGLPTLSQTVYVDSANVVTPVAPANFTLGACPPDPQAEFDHDFLCEPDPSNLRVLLVTSYSDVGVPTVTAYNFPSMTLYAGDVSLLVECVEAPPASVVEIDQYDTAPVPVCYLNAGVRTTWHTYDRVLFNNVAPGTEIARNKHWTDGVIDSTAVPVGIAVPCDALHTVAFTEPGCALGVPFTRVTTVDYDALGNPIATAVEYINSAGATVPAPAQFTLGDCSPIIESHIFDAAAGVPWTPAAIPAARTLVGLTMSVLTFGAGNAVTDANGTVVSAIPSGFTTSWSSDFAGVLVPPQSINPGTAPGRIIVTMAVR